MRIQLAIAAVLGGCAIAALIAWDKTREPPMGEVVYNRISNNRSFQDRMRVVVPITDYTPAPERAEASSAGIQITKFAVPGGVRAFLRVEEIVDDRLVQELRGRVNTDADVKRAIEVERGKLLSLTERQLLDSILAADPALLKQENETAGVIRKTLLLTAINPLQSILQWSDRSVIAMTYAQSGASDEGIVIIFQFDDDGKLILNAKMAVAKGTPPERVRGAITKLTAAAEPKEAAPTSGPMR